MALLAEHVPDRYQHAIRHFGLFSAAFQGQNDGGRIRAFGAREAPLSEAVELEGFAPQIFQGRSPYR